MTVVCRVCGDKLSTPEPGQTDGWLRRFHEHTEIEWVAVTIVLMHQRELTQR